MKCHYRFHKSLTLAPVLNHTCSVHTLPHCVYLFKQSSNKELGVLSVKNCYISIWNYHIQNDLYKRITIRNLGKSTDSVRLEWEKETKIKIK
jgi:hypothetical protein